MKIERTHQFKKEFLRLPEFAQRMTIEAITTYVHNSQHPSLRVKKMGGKRGIWEMRVTKSYRITFYKIDEGVCLRHVGTHDILREE